MEAYRLEDIALRHDLDTAFFIPMTAARLAGDSAAESATLEVTLRDVLEPGDVSRQIEIAWSSRSVGTSLPFDERTITEWAACGVACIVLDLYTETILLDVAGDGERVDFWMREGINRVGLEVSGTLTQDLERRHRAKVRQLLQNPRRLNGFVFVVEFSTRRAILSFHQIEG